MFLCNGIVLNKVFMKVGLNVLRNMDKLILIGQIVIGFVGRLLLYEYDCIYNLKIIKDRNI